MQGLSMMAHTMRQKFGCDYCPCYGPQEAPKDAPVFYWLIMLVCHGGALPVWSMQLCDPGHAAFEQSCPTATVPRRWCRLFSEYCTNGIVHLLFGHVWQLEAGLEPGSRRQVLKMLGSAVLIRAVARCSHVCALHASAAGGSLHAACCKS